MRITHKPALAVAGNFAATESEQSVNIDATYDATTNTLTYTPDDGDVDISHGNSGVITISLDNASTDDWVFDSISITGENSAPTDGFSTNVNNRNIVINDNNTVAHTAVYVYDYCITMKNKKTGATQTVDPKIQNEP
jgi:hypothetical protein